MKTFIRNPISFLLLFVPIAAFLEHSHVSAPFIFFSAALAIIPIAVLIVHATEQIAVRTGDAIGGLLNATFGNAPELIISLVALKAGYFAMVRASLIGAILANLLLALGFAMLLGGLRYHDQRFNPTATRAYSTMMFIAAVSMAVPRAFSRSFPNCAGHQVEVLNIGIAILLLVAYGLYLLFSLRTHPEAFESVEDAHAAHAEEEKWPLAVAVVCLIGSSVLAAWMSEILVGAAEETGKSLGMSGFFIGVVFLAILGGAAEAASAIAVARKNRMDMTVAIALGSLYSDRAIRRSRACDRELFHRAGALHAVLQSWRDRRFGNSRPYRSPGVRRRSVKLVSRYSAYDCLRDHCTDVLPDTGL